MKEYVSLQAIRAEAKQLDRFLSLFEPVSEFEPIGGEEELCENCETNPKAPGEIYCSECLEKESKIENDPD